MRTNKFRYARLCSFTNKPMNAGYCIGDGMEYAFDEEQMKKHATSEGMDWEQELKDWDKNPDNAWFYYTDWDEIDTDSFFDVNGDEWTLEGAREQLLEASIELIAVANENTCCLWEDTMKATADCIVLEEVTLEFEDNDNVITKRKFKNLNEIINRVEHITNLLSE